jgi:multisubunit Na+/H+ antiporter MnhC subunit
MTGGLVVAIIQALRQVANAAKNNNDLWFLACIAECILACLASIVEYINKWAFVYVGIYGFDYIRSAKEVYSLFMNRGWEAIIADSLISDTLFLVSLVVGAIMGSIAVLLQYTSQTFTQDTGNDALGIAFFLGFIVGLSITSILMSVIGSAVNTVIVLFAEAPNEFQRNHPELSQRMRTLWAQVYPGSV